MPTTADGSPVAVPGATGPGSASTQPDDSRGSDHSPWKTSGTREIYSNPWIHVREDTVIQPDGSSGIYGVVTMQNPSVFVVAVTDDDKVLTVTLYRYATAGTSLEVPAGGCDGQNPLIAAQRELLEETGYAAQHWQQIGVMNALNGVCKAPEYVFLARGLGRTTPTEAGEIDTDEEQAAEGITAVRAIAWPELMQLIATGGITDGETVAALMFAAVSLGRVA